MDYLKSKFENKHILVTGGAGFIGSNITETLLSINSKVTVFDNLETGRIQNLEAFRNHPNFTFVQGDLRNYEDCLNVMEGIDAVTHQGALGSVPRSIEFPHKTHEVNATGFLNILQASKEKKIKRFVFASSSSVYGDSAISPKVEGVEGNLLSPYAVTKELNEQYAKVYFRLHGLQTIGLRYFNVFGPNQDPNGVYAAAIPKFISKMKNGEEIVINGDGEQTRDFTYVKNAVLANLLALSSDNQDSYGKTYNVACGDSYSLNYIINTIKGILVSQDKFNEKCLISNGPERQGDIRNSLANIGSISKDLGYEAKYSFHDGIVEYLQSL
ncbi:MAG: SDR family NAD(P)-dependent oxidoreductase [Flavobacteriia bacterium]|jgi:UDP-N-acetylglucosamine 4-epimerase